MWENIIAYFAKRHVLTNALFLLVIIGGIVSWRHTNKEELPAVTFDFVRISVSYPGATAQDVEYFVTKPIEEQIRGLDGIYRIRSTSSIGQANITAELEPGHDDVDEVVTEIRNEVLSVDLPEEVLTDPRIRVFKTAKKAILDIALFHKDHEILTVEGRQELQRYALALENQLLSLPEVHSINRRGYLQEEIQIEVYPEKLRRYEIPFNAVMREIRENHVRKPAGTLEADQEPKVTLFSELNTPGKLHDVIIQGGFEGQVIRLGEIAEIAQGYERTESVSKVNGYEAIMFNVVKNASAGILEALDAVNKRVEQFRDNNLEGTPIELVLLDDESIDVRNRLHLISVNGSIGFVLILLTLFIFLDKRSGFWVAMGIPFTFCFTIIFASLLGHTINGMTLAAVIIVMGIVVDDAIVVAENISRMRQQGVPRERAIVEGTSFVLKPIIASIVTTCVAFIPLYFFTARHGRLIEFIPPVIFLMLAASLIESIFILPGHMNLEVRKKSREDQEKNGHWFERVEDRYGALLARALHARWIVMTIFIVLLVLAGYIVSHKMKYLMFPNEETRDIVLMGETEPGSTRYETARKLREIEDVITPYIGKEVVGFRSDIAQSRRGGAVQENNFRMIVEIVPKEERAISADEFIAVLEGHIAKLDGFPKIQFQKSRWGQDSGSPIEVIVQQSNDEIRHTVATAVAEAMRENPALKSVEIEEGLRVPEYRIGINHEMIKRLSISPSDVASTFRAALEGTVLYEFSNGDEDVYVRFSTVEAAKTNIEEVLDLPVENQRNYLVPLRNVVTVEKTISPNAIERRDLRRTSLVYAGMEANAGKTPLEIAEAFENDIFPKILAKYPTTTLTFGGEVQDTRDSTKDFENAIGMVLLLVFIILAILFESIWKAILIMLAIPFGLVGIILAFYLHGKGVYGFYAAVGALGLSGVVINDSIIMLVKLDRHFKRGGSTRENNGVIADIAKTRLRAVLLTTLTTVAGVMPTAYGFAGYDAMLAEMMLSLAWGMIGGTIITLFLIPCLYSIEQQLRSTWFQEHENA